ncbi:P-loop containing nucleoside triphosphate hydrolase protein [Chytriomyces sp. MP71]|nr:P-loop containing nucleoside triphosphate hydrolase protein [Chytriomyces sp. MP71]
MMRTVLSLKRPEPQEDNNPLPDVSKFHEFLLSPGPALVVCDESHMIKNPKSGIGIYIGNIATKSRICLTGWPLQNNLEEYFAMIDFVSRGFLGTLGEFRNQYVHPIANGFYADSTEADKIISKQRLFVLVNIINPLLQRIDDDILKDDLPPKTEYIVSVRLSKIQKNIYKSYLAHLRATADVSNIISRFPTFVTVCNHPSICKSAADGKALDPDSESFYDNSVIKSILAQQDVTDWTDSQLSLKIVLLEHIVTQSVALGDKVLVFSRSIPTIEFIKMKLSKFKLLVMTGSTNHRQRLIDDFNNSEKGFNVFIISTVAGGIGVNVASANRVVLMDHSWNPSGEQQAISRSYRYGQTKTVYIYRLLTYGAFEERIFQKNMYKIILSTQVVDKRAMEKNAFFKAEMKQYFVDPPEAPESQLVTGAVYNDSVMQSAVELFGKDIIKVETSEELFREVEDELTEAQREMAKDTLKKEVIRRRNGAKFKETSRTAAFSSSTTAFNLGSSDTLVQQHFIDLTTDDVDAMELDRSPPLPPSKPSTSGQPSRSKQLLQTDWEETDIAFMALSGSLLDDYDS